MKTSLTQQLQERAREEFNQSHPVVTRGHHHYRRERYLQDTLDKIIASTVAATLEEVEKKGSTGDLVVKNFQCSEHGRIKPTPYCPKCFARIQELKKGV